MLLSRPLATLTILLSLLLPCQSTLAASIVVSSGPTADTNYSIFARMGHDYAELLNATWANGAGRVNDELFGWPEYGSTLGREVDAWLQKSLYDPDNVWSDDEGYWHTNIEQYVITPSGEVDFAATRAGITEATERLSVIGNDRLIVTLIDHGGIRPEAEGGYVYGSWSGRWSPDPGRLEYPTWIDAEPLLTGPEIDELFAWPGERVFIVATCNAGALWPYIDDGKTTLMGQSTSEGSGYVLPMRHYIGGPRDGELYEGDYSYADRLLEAMQDESLRSWSEVHEWAADNRLFQPGNASGLIEDPIFMGPDGIWSFGEVVDGADLAWIGLNWNPEGAVNGNALAWVGMNWSPAGVVGAVPEPGGVAVLLAGLISIAGVSKRRLRK